MPTCLCGMEPLSVMLIFYFISISSFSLSLPFIFKVNDNVIPIGKDLEPILLHLNYPADSDGTLATVSNGFSKSTTILELRVNTVQHSLS